MSTAQSSSSSFDSWTDDENYSTFTSPESERGILSQVKNMTFYHLESPKIEASDSTYEDDPIYENLDRKGMDTVVVYGQVLKSQLDQLNKRKRRELKAKLVSLFKISMDDTWSTEHIISLVEEQLALLLDNNPKDFRKTAEELCSLLHQIKNDKETRLATIGKSLRKIFIK